MRFLVIGAGKQGSACALDLLQQPAVTSVVLADKVVGRVPAFLEPHKGGGRLELLKLDLADQSAVRGVFGRVDAVLSAVPYYHNAELTRVAVEAGVHFADLGGNTDIVLQQKQLDAQAKAKKISVVPDCGLAPGMVNILAAEGI